MGRPATAPSGWWRLLLAVLGLGLMVLVARRWAGPYLSGDAVKGLVAQAGLWAPAAFVLLYTVRPLLFMPASVLTVTAGLVWGPMLGTAYTAAGATAGAWVAFFLARRLGREFVARRLRGRFAIIDRLAAEQGLSVILSLRLVPLFPFDAVSYAAGLTGVRTGPFVLATLVGALPGTLAYAYLGASLGGGPRQWGRGCSRLAGAGAGALGVPLVQPAPGSVRSVMTRTRAGMNAVGGT